MSNDAPNFVETIVCLAASKRPSGRCIAGKRTSDHSWFRPVSNRPGQEILEYDGLYLDGTIPQVLDIINIACAEPRPQEHQKENVEVDHRFPWEKKGRASWKDVRELVDRDADLWATIEDSSGHNKNYRVPKDLVDESKGSLRLIELDEIVLEVAQKTLTSAYKTIWAHFTYKSQEYRLLLTDPEYERICLKNGAGEYRFRSVIACISLGRLHTDRNGEIAAHKFVASIITQKMADGLGRFFTIEWLKNLTNGFKG